MRDTMPKAKPDQVIVHRIELQEKEREALDAYMTGQTLKNVVVPSAIVGGVGVLGYIGYKAAKDAFNWGEDMFDEFKQQVNDINGSGVGAWEAVVGKKTYTDSEGNTYNNPFAGVPVIGSLFGSGINLGIAFPAPDIKMPSWAS